MVLKEEILMAGNLKEEYADEKRNLQKFLTGARMTDVCYGETFNLLFTQNFYSGESPVFQCKTIQMRFVIDAPCWFGDRDEWMARVEAFEDKSDLSESEDCLMACEFIRLRYHNLIDVEKVDFWEDHVSITFPQGNILSVSYDGELDCEWYLEEVSQKKESEKVVIGCCGNELFQNHIGEYMFKVRDRLCLGGTYCVSVEGDVWRLRSGTQLMDEKGNIFVIETVGMSHYRNIENIHRYAEIVLCGDVENLGENLFLTD